MEIAIIKSDIKDKIKCYKCHKETGKMAEFYATREEKGGGSTAIPLCGECVEALVKIIDQKVLNYAVQNKYV